MQAPIAAILEALRGPLTAALQKQQSGRQFRDTILEMYGTMVYNQVKTAPQAGQRILQALAADAQFGPVVAGYRPHMERFVEEFLSDDEDDEDDEQPQH